MASLRYVFVRDKKKKKMLRDVAQSSKTNSDLKGESVCSLFWLEAGVWVGSQRAGFGWFMQTFQRFLFYLDLFGNLNFGGTK